MKNKKLTYLLGLVVVIVWGLIIYRIFDAAGGDNDSSAIPVRAKATKEPYNDYALTADTTHLLLNYRDPFGLKKQVDTTRVAVVRTHRVGVVKPTVNWSFIKYSGYIRNPDSKKIIALLNISGKNVMLAEGESTGNIKLLKNMRDSVKINFNGNTKFITLSQRTL